MPQRIATCANRVSENDNLRNEYAALFPDVPRDIVFARVALGRPPEAVNLWIGNSHSVTAMHRDNYENIYVQVLGQKHFVLLPPLCQPCVNEQLLQPFTYEREDVESGGRHKTRLSLVQDEEELDEPDGAGDYVPFALWDPDRPDENKTAYSHLARPMRVTLNPGDMLYLPAMWYHKVSQSTSKEGVCVAVNYWYDMDFTGPLVPLTSFVRAIHQKAPV